MLNKANYFFIKKYNLNYFIFNYFFIYINFIFNTYFIYKFNFVKFFK